MCVKVNVCGCRDEVWWMGGCLFQGTGKCGVWMMNDLNLFGWFLCLCHPYTPEHLWNVFISLVTVESRHI